MKRHFTFILLGLIVLLFFCALFAESQYQTKVYKPSGTSTGGDSLNVVNGGQISVFAGGVIEVVRGGKLIGTFSTSIDSFAVVKDNASDVTDSSLVVYLSSGNPVVSWRATDDDEANATINTSDQLLFAGASGGYQFSNGDMIANSVDFIAAGDTIHVKSSPTSDPADSTLFFTLNSGEPIIAFRASDDDAFEITSNTSDQMVFQNAGGGYTFDNKLVLQNLETIDNSSNGYVDILGAMRMAGASFQIRNSATSDETDSTMTFTITSGVPSINFKGADDDAYEITINTSDQMLINNAAAVIADTVNVTNFKASGYGIVDGALIGRAGDTVAGYVNLGDSTDTGYLTHLIHSLSGDVSRTLNASETGKFINGRTLGAKRTFTLPPAAAGISFPFFVNDSDSLIFTAGSGDSIITWQTSVFNTSKSVAGAKFSGRLTAIDETYYTLLESVGANVTY